MIHQRGSIYEEDFHDGVGPKLYLVVSNNVRNRNLRSVLAVRLTTTRNGLRPSIVELPAEEAFHDPFCATASPLSTPTTTPHELGR